MSLHDMLDEVKEALRPDTSLLRLRDEVIDRINELLSRADVQARAVPGGSVAKNTYLADDHDIDIFIRFSLEYLQQEDVLADILEPLLKEFRPKRVHGSRDYFQFETQGVEFEVIPVLAVDSPEQARNVTDMSPLHVSYFQSEGVGLEDEVRLAKQFCKSAGVYGAESYIRGFSGHVIDILIIHYGSFMDLVKAATTWKPPVIIDIESHHTDALSAIDTAKHAPLVVVDPVQPERNAAAALSQEVLTRFIGRCKAFIREPSESFFVIERFDENALLERLKRSPGAVVLVRVSHDAEDKKDVAGSRVRKAYERLVRALEDADFTVAEDGWSFSYGNDSLLWLVTEQHSLARLKQRQGPPVSRSEDAQRFRETHGSVQERDGRLYAMVERELREPQQVVEAMREDLQTHIGVTISSVRRLENRS